jgi:hypothetical protein
MPIRGKARLNGLDPQRNHESNLVALDHCLPEQFEPFHAHENFNDALF